MQKEPIVVHTDGGSRGNPGPAACAFVVEDLGEQLIKQSKYLGVTTNNVAEYTGVIIALKWLIENGLTNRSISFFLDSELVVKQVKGIYKVKDENLRNLFFEVLTLLKSFDEQVVFTHVRREKNKIADQLVNDELDKRR